MQKGPDDELMPMIDLANVACGFHGGDPVTMHKTIKLAKKYNVPVGAHPSLPDREGFGRRYIDISPADLYDQLVYQIGALVGMLRAEGMELNHVKTHGYLYRFTQASEEHCEAVIRAIKLFNVPCVQVAGSRQEKMAAKFGVPFIPEFYPDLHYDTAGGLVPLLTSSRVPIDTIKEKVEKLINQDIVLTQENEPVRIGLEGRSFSCCIHSDLPSKSRNGQSIAQSPKLTQAGQTL
ncbi:hypothetical protein A1O3_10235 [Capronia epimyces CBS 606.96]|uniref:Lactam utilization protein lamB n=1 Tax=Capronia epimyces CBS 606.96 TaxID=1182542 RepID=W9X9D2_9EURO|nr:uncharacterized protein A1O3_10235 [Capronia epimyces CBS 606.96]EXJ77077.1 hypothetical protein A1O3_10235 [Capronia epimyces CBS 606.96]